MILPTCLQNIDGTSLDIATIILRHLSKKSSTTLPLTLFKSEPPFSGLSNFLRSDLPPLDYKKTDEKSVAEYLNRSI